jgi:primase-polymerase (primpol)-like protein
MAANFDGIHPTLQRGKHHCNWRPVPDDKGKIGKKPWDAGKQCGLAWSNSLNLIAFDEAVARYEAGQDKPERDSWHFGGIGYIIPPESDLSCVDLDDKLGPVLNEAGEPTREARAVLERLKSYSEISPSGKGIHVWCKAHIKGSNIPETNYDGISVEMFVQSHHVTLTGQVIPGFEVLEGRQAEAQAFYNELKAINSKTEPPRKEKKTSNDAGKRAYCLKALDDECQILASTSRGMAELVEVGTTS